MGKKFKHVSAPIPPAEEITSDSTELSSDLLDDFSAASSDGEPFSSWLLLLTSNLPELDMHGYETQFSRNQQQNKTKI